MSSVSPAKENAAGLGSSIDAPRHIAIIMDGNGRWAQQRGKPRSMGHEAGVEALRRTVEAAGDLGLEYLTVYAFSTENWSRPDREVNFLMTLLKLYVKRDVAKLNREGVKVRMIGARDNLAPDILRLIEDAESLTANNQKLTLNIAFNYGARQEIINAAQMLAQRCLDGDLMPEQISSNDFETCLYTGGQPDPDLIIRTSGEHRLSNFLLWQSAYSELLFLDILWPEFESKHLDAAIDAFKARDRRYGAVKAGGEG